MTTLREIFPNYSLFQPTAVRWDDEFQWNDLGTVSLGNTLVQDAIAAQGIGSKEYFERGLVLRDDLSKLTENAEDEEKLLFIDAIKFAVSQPFIHGLRNAGEFAQAYDWILWSISRNHKIHEVVNDADYSLPPFDGASERVNNFATQFLVDWISSAYYVAVKLGGLDQLSTNHFWYCLGVAVKEADGADNAGGVEAFVVLVNWAAHVGHEALSDLMKTVENWLKIPTISTHQKVRLATLLIGPGSAFAKQNPADFARSILETHPTGFRDHERLQFLSVATDSHEAWFNNEEEILLEINAIRCNVEKYHASMITADVAMEARVILIYPLIYLLSRVPDLAGVLKVLCAWHGKTYDEGMAARTLLVLPNNSNGVTWIWPGGGWAPVDQAVEHSLEQMTVAASDAFRDYYRGPAGDRLPVIDARLRGTPNFQHATALEHQVLEHYKIRNVSHELPAQTTARFLLTFPNHNVPLFSLVNRDLKAGFVQNISLSSDFVEPNIRDLYIWPGETLMTAAELEFICAAGQQAGINVRIWEGGFSKNDFRDYYSDSDADLLWVTGHGSHHPGDVLKCGLELGGEILFNLNDFSDLPPVTRPRAMVMNICSGGSARMIGGMGSTGIANTLTNGQQVAVTHGWPIDMYAALAFGTVFFSCLPEYGLKMGLFQAQTILQNQDDILTHLRAVSETLQVVERLSPEHVRPHLENIMSWGAATLYC